MDQLNLNGDHALVAHYGLAHVIEKTGPRQASSAVVADHDLKDRFVENVLDDKGVDGLRLRNGPDQIIDDLGYQEGNRIGLELRVFSSLLVHEKIARVEDFSAVVIIEVAVVVLVRWHLPEANEYPG